MSGRRPGRRARARSEEGFTLVELLVVMVLLISMTLAILSSLEGFSRAKNRGSAVTAAQAAARQGIDQLARELRNGAHRGGTGAVLERIGPEEMVLLVPNAAGTEQTRVRYCVGPSAAGRQTLWRQSDTLGATVGTAPADAACPGPAWQSSGRLVTDLVPAKGSTAVAPFTFDAASASQATRVWVTLAVQPDYPGATPVALSSGVTLRNQNRAPVARFTASTTSRSRVILDGSNSADPDDQTLAFRWSDGTTVIGSGAILDYQAPSTGERAITLTVTDPPGATASTTQTVVIQ